MRNPSFSVPLHKLFPCYLRTLYDVLSCRPSRLFVVLVNIERCAMSFPLCATDWGSPIKSEVCSKFHVDQYNLVSFQCVAKDISSYLKKTPRDGRVRHVDAYYYFLADETRKWINIIDNSANSTKIVWISVVPIAVNSIVEPGRIDCQITHTILDYRLSAPGHLTSGGWSVNMYILIEHF